jgi:hypothetical protein
MAGSKNSEVTATKIQAVLSAGWAAKIAEINASYDDGITLVAVDGWFFAPQRDFGGTLNIVAMPAPIERAYKGSERLNGQAIIVGLVVGGNTPVGTLSPQEVVSAMCWRYWECVVEILDANNKLSLSGVNWADEMLVTDAEPFYRGLDDLEAGFEQRMAITVIVTTSYST